MIVAIDPDVFTAAESDLNSTLSLIGLSQKCSEMRFAVDGDEIEREYLRLFFRYYKEVTNTEDDNESLKAILKLLRIILDDTDEYREVIANHRERWLDQLIAKHGCTTKVEPELLGICQNAKGMGLVLLLVGNKASRLGLRNRGLRNAKVRWKFRSSMHWLDVRFTDDTDIVPAPVKEVPEKDLQDRLFELQSGFHLQTQEPQLRCIPTPPGMGEQIDIYARKEYREAGHPVLETLVGECKLRKEGNEENKPIASGEVTQTFRKVYAAARYEHRRLSRSLARPIVRMRGALITNVFEFEGEKEDFVLCAINHLNANWPMSVHNLCSSIEIDFMEASLPRGWTNRADWEINHLETVETWRIIGQESDGAWVWDIEIGDP